MPTAWEVLVSKSTLPDDGINTAWDHLNNQQGGQGNNFYISEEIQIDESTILASFNLEVPLLNIEEVFVEVDAVDIAGVV